MCLLKSDMTKYRPANMHVAEWVWQEEGEKVWEIQIQGRYYTTTPEKDDAIVHVKVLRVQSRTQTSIIHYAIMLT